MSIFLHKTNSSFTRIKKEEGEQKNCLAVYDLSTGQLCRKLKAKVSFISVEINEELSVIVACLENAQIIVYDLVSGSEK